MTIAKLRIVALAASLSVALGGCTPAGGSTPSVMVTPSATPTRTASPSPTSTWSADQTAAVAAVQGYIEASDRLSNNPSGFTKAQMKAELARYSEGGMADTSWFVDMAKRGHHQTGQIKILRVVPTKVANTHDDRGLEVHVLVCQDQSDLQIVNSQGKPVKGEQMPKFNLRQYTVLKRSSVKKWKVAGAATVNGACG